MTTRTIVLITNETATKFYFYRHADGYPAITGADVLAAARAALVAVDSFRPAPELAAINYLLAQSTPNRYNPSNPLYRMIAAPPPDIEHFYHIDCCGDYVFINYASGNGADGDRLEAETEPFAFYQFRDMINAARDHSNERLREIAAIDPHYADHKPYPRLD